MAAEKTTMKVNIVAADHPVWHGEATSVTIPASEGGMGILPCLLYTSDAADD